MAGLYSNLEVIQGLRSPLPTLLASRDNPVLSVLMWNLFIANESAAAAASARILNRMMLACLVLRVALPNVENRRGKW